MHGTPYNTRHAERERARAAPRMARMARMGEEWARPELEWPRNEMTRRTSRLRVLARGERTDKDYVGFVLSSMYQASYRGIMDVRIQSVQIQANERRDEQGSERGIITRCHSNPSLLPPSSSSSKASNRSPIKEEVQEQPSAAIQNPRNPKMCKCESKGDLSRNKTIQKATR